MTSNQAKSLCHQLLHAYAANGRAEKPVHLILTGLQVCLSPALMPSTPFHKLVLACLNSCALLRQGLQRLCVPSSE